MFNNPMGRKISNEVHDINEKFIMHDKERKAPIKGGKRGGKSLPNTPFKVSVLDDILDEQPNGTEFFGPMSGFGEGTDYQNGFQYSEGARGAGRTKKQKGVALWNKIEKNLRGGNISRQIGGNLIESKGYEMHDPMTLNELISGGAMPKSEIVNIVGRLAEKSPSILNPLIDRLPINDDKKMTAKDVVEKISSVIHAAAPIVSLILKLRGGKRGAGRNDFEHEMKEGGALSKESIKSFLQRNKELLGTVKDKIMNSEGLKHVPKILSIAAPIIGALLAAKAGHSIYNSEENKLKRGNDAYQKMRKREQEDYYVDENGNFQLPASWIKEGRGRDSDSDSDSESDYDFDKKKKGGKMLVPNELLRGNYTGGAKKRAPSKWNLFVKKIMEKTGKNMKDSMIYIKKNNLWQSEK